MSGKSAEAYRTISEAGDETSLPSHVLRFWESKFPHLKPVKRAGGRRFYRPQDILLIKGLKHLLYEEGYTIKGAQKYLKDHGVAHVAGLAENEQTIAPSSTLVESVQAGFENEQHQPSTPDLFAALPNDADEPFGEDDRARLLSAYEKLMSARERLNAVLRT